MATDDFNRADNADIGANWDTGSGTFGTAMRISNNQVKVSITGAVCGETWNVATYTDVQVDLLFVAFAATTGLIGTMLRFTAATDNGYTCTARVGLGHTCAIQRWDAGVGTVLSESSPTTWAATDVLTGLAVGSNFTLKKNGTAMVGPVSDATYTSGRVGMDMYEGASDADRILDDFTVAIVGRSGLLVTNRWTW